MEVKSNVIGNEKMEYLTGRVTALASWGLNHLQNTPLESFPPDISDECLNGVLNPQGNKAVVFNGEVNVLLECIKQLSNEPRETLDLHVQAHFELEEKITGMYISSFLWNVCKVKSQKWSRPIVYCPPGSKKGKQVSGSFTYWLDQQRVMFKQMKRHDVLAKINEWYFRQSIHNTNTDQASHVIDKLIESKLIEVTGVDGKIKYNFPNASFAILCYDHLLKTSTARINELCKQRDSREVASYDILQEVIGETNDILKALKQDVLDTEASENLEQDGRVRFAVSGWRKRKSADSGTTLGFLQNRKRFKPSPDSASSSESLLDSLCKTIGDMSIEELMLIPSNMTYECAIIVLEMSKMDESKPKTERSLLNMLKDRCSFIYFTPLNFSKWSRLEGGGEYLRAIEIKENLCKCIISLDPHSFLKTSLAKKAKLQTKHQTQQGKGRHDQRALKQGRDNREKSETSATDSLSMESFVKGCITYADELAEMNSTLIIPADVGTKVEMLSRLQKFLSLQEPETLGAKGLHDIQNSFKDKLMRELVYLQELPEEACLDALQSCGVVTKFKDNPLKAKDHIESLQMVCDKRLTDLRAENYNEKAFKKEKAGSSSKGRRQPRGGRY